MKALRSLFAKPTGFGTAGLRRARICGSSELNILLSLAFSKGGAEITALFPNSYFDVSGTAGVKNVIAVGTSDESLALGDISTIGFVFVKNLDATNYITIGPDGSLYPIKLKPGEANLFRWNAAAIHVKANTAPCNLEYVLIPD